jgi:hypothetical protein
MEVTTSAARAALTARFATRLKIPAETMWLLHDYGPHEKYVPDGLNGFAAPKPPGQAR